MKQIRLGKLLFLNIITLGIYQLFWLINRRQELIKTTKQKILSKNLLIASYLGIIISVAAIIIHSITASSPENLSYSALTLFASSIVLFMMIYYVWMWSFIKAAAIVTGPRAPFGWLAIHLFLIGFDLIYVLQYFFNRKLDPKQTKPSKKFVNYSVGLIIALYAISIVFSYFSNMEYFEQNKVVEQTPEMTKYLKQADLLSKKYDTCINNLDKKYEYLTDENEAEYSADYDACETIRLQQNKAVDEYEKLVNRQNN